MKLRLLSLILFVTLPVSAGWCDDLHIEPFQISNRSPVIDIYGLPAPGTAWLLPPGASSAELALDVASHFTQDAAGSERAFFDGETARWALSVRHGLTSNLEGQIEIPYLRHSKGHLDGFIEGFHDFFGFPQGGRTQAPRNRLLFRYSDGGEDRIRLEGSAQGVGDIKAGIAWQSRSPEQDRLGGIALHLSLKLPTGDSDRLLGSGSTDLALWGTGANYWDWGSSRWGLFGAVGALGISHSKILPERQRHLVGFGTIGGGWQPAAWIDFKIQLDAHTPFFDSGLVEFGRGSAQLTMGGDLKLGARTILEIGVAEDVATESAPDVVFRLALRSSF